MKIGYLVHDMNSNTGGGQYAANLILGMKSLGHEVVVLKESKDDFPGHVILQRGWKMFLCIRDARKLLKDCEIIHAIDGYPYGIIAWLSNLTLRRKLIISALGTYAVAPLYNFRTAYLLKRAYLAASVVVPISHITQNYILEKVPLKNIVVVTPGIEAVERVQNRNEKNGQYLLGVGGLKKRKGYHVSLEAFGIIAPDFPLLRYCIVADQNPQYRAQLDKIIQDYKIEDRVVFLNSITEEELRRLYAEADVFVLTPINTESLHFEGFGLVYLEAARAGLPVVGTIGTGADDAVLDGKNGILVPQNDVTMTAQALKTILSSREKRQYMSDASYVWANQNSLGNQTKKFLAIYEMKN